MFQRLINVAVRLTAISAVAYLAAWYGYDMGTHEAARRVIEYGKEHPDETFGNFVSNIENKAT